MDALRSLFESLEAEILPPNDPLVHEGLKQLARALKAVVIRDEGATLIGWTKLQLDQVLAILTAVVCTSVDLPADEGYSATLESLFTLTVEFCVRTLECFALRPRSGLFNEQLQRRLLLLLEAATVDGKAERASGISLREISPEFLLELSAAGDQDDNKSASAEAPARQQEDAGNSQNILAVLSTEHIFVNGLQGDDTVKVLSSRRHTMVNISHKNAVVRHGCVQRLSALCRRLLATQAADYEADSVSDKVYFVTRLLAFLVELTRTSPYRDFVEETVAEVVKMACSLANILKLSREVGDLDSDDAQEGSSEGCLPLLLDALLLFSEALSPAQVLTQNLRTFLAASILDKMDTSKTRQEGTGTGSVQHLIVASTPQLVNYFLRLLQADQFHASDGRFSFRRQLTGEDLATGLGQECQLRSEVFMMNEVRRQSDHLQAVFPPNGDWLDKLVSVAAVLHSHGLRLRPLVDVTPSVHSEEDSATISMDSLTVTSEDDALFGDLFSESGRHSVNSEETLQITCAKKVGGAHIALLQTTCQVLYFLKNYIFCPDWHRPTYEAARRHLSRDHLDVLLNVHHSQATLMGKHISADQTLLMDLHKSSFDVLFALVDRGALSESLQEHLFRQILKDGDSQCCLSRNMLVLIGKLLISRFEHGAAASNDPLLFELWKSFSDSVVSKAKSIRGSEADMMEKITTVLPSRFHMEVLFMAFHSLDDAGRSDILLNLISRLGSCRPDKQTLGSLTCWSLLVSRLVLAVKYLVSHFGFFPKWLIVELSKKLRYERPETPLNGSMREGPFPSWAALFGRHIMEGPPGAPHLIDEQFVQQLFDVDFPTLDNLLPILDMKTLKAVLCDTLEAWTGRIIKSTEELILERYLFLLCWDVLQHCFSSCQPTLPWEHSASTTLEFCFELSGSICAGLTQLDHDHTEQWSEFLIQSYGNLAVSLRQGRVNFASWDLLRQGAMLALLLLPLQAGSKGVGKQEQLFGQVFLRVVDSPLFLESLSSILGWYVEATTSCVSLVLQQKPSVSSILQACLPEAKRNQLLEKAGANLIMLKSLLRWGSSASWRNELISMLAPTGAWGSAVSTDFLPVLLHGFSLSSVPGDASLVSCMLSLEGLLDIVATTLRARTADTSTSGRILATVMSMKVNSSYDSLQKQCDAVLEAVLVPKEDRLLYSDVYLLKHMEDLLTLVCTSKGTMTSDFRDGIAVQAVELFNAIRTDQDRCSALGIRFCGNEQPEARADFISSFIGQGSFSPFIDVLDGFFNDSVNAKMMQFFVDVLESPSSFQGTFKQHLQAKLLSMETHILAAWFEQRLLGCAIRDNEGACMQLSSSVAVRDAAIRFIQSLSSGEGHSKELATHLLDALLMNLQKAFIYYDASSAKSYFKCAAQLLNGEQHLKKVAHSVITVLSKVPIDGGHLEGLKYLLSFLNSVLTACGAQKALPQSRFGKSKSSTLQNPALSTMKARVSRRGSEQSLNMAADPGTADDATSVDDDEDDATSDGEMASLDREEEDEINNSERFLAAKVCTFTSSGSNFMEQHWYFCYTCDLTVSKGCCSVCAKVCHRGHKVVYSRLSRFFCDCGAGGVRGSSCSCLKPRKYLSSTTAPKLAHETPEPLLAANHDRLQLSDSDSETDSDEYKEGRDVFDLKVSDQEERRLLSLLLDLGLENQLLSLSERLLDSSNLGADAGGNEEIQLGEDKVLEFKTDILQLRRSFKSGSFDMKIKAEYSNSRELRSHLLSGNLSKSLLTVSSRGRLAAGEGDKVTIFDVGQLIGQPTAIPVIVDKTSMKNLSRNSVRFELVHLVFNPTNENYLAVGGYEDCIVFTVNPRGEVTDRLAIELALQDAYIRRIAWLPGSQVELMVVTNRFVKIFDLSSDKISPMHYFTILEDQIVDAALLLAGQGQLLVLVLSQQGILYSQRICKGSDSGARILTDVVPLPERYKRSKGVSLHYSNYLKLVFANLSDGLTLVCRLDSNATLLSEVSSVVEVDQEKTKPAGFHHWKDIFDGTGLFTCLSSQKSNSAAIVHIGTTDIQAQHMRSAGSSVAVRVDGIASYRSMTKDRSHVMILHDDGSLHVFLYVPAAQGAPAAETQKPNISLQSEQMKKLGAALLGSRAPVNTPSFPLDFFEKTSCITPDIKFGGDILRNTDSDGVKLSLAQDDGFVESLSPSGFKIVVSNSNPDIVMVGFRVHVGNTSASHIPSEMRVFQRSIKIEEGVRCWYDIPFTSSEALLADEEFSITICSTFNGTSLPRIDNLEIYGRSKEDFGWKEKLDAVLDIENLHLSSNSGSSASKSRRLQTASPVEQVFHETFKVLCGYYSLSRLHSSDFNVEKCKAACAPVLEDIFESDRESLLQSAGRRVLRALSPSKEAYYQAKDMMSLTGVSRSCPSLASKLSFGGTRIPWIVQEFSSQVRTVCKISLHRPSNLATYLERNGSSIVDALVSVLWEMLLSDSLELQTVNDLVVLTVDLIYGYAECLSAHMSTASVSPAVSLLQKLLFAPHDTVPSASSLAILSRLLQVPLPKQTMLSMDDGGENSRTGSVHSESGASTVVSGQVMLEEDPGTASVQYCCDGCSTVPILRRRWHCNECPDFDLCETCFEVMDGDQLPPPHTRSHAMSAIPIEADSGAENQDIQFTSIDDMSEESLLQMATELSLQSTPPSTTSVLEGNENCELSEIVETKAGAISASKSMVNSLLLNGLLENLRGWTRTTTGTVAIPVMQLFYRLATASSSQFESSGSGNLQKLVKSLLDELDFENCIQVRSRSNAGEMLILVFMFFTLLLRYWHQPGSLHGQARQKDEGQQESSEYDRACAALRQQSLLKYVLNITQQLSQVYKSSSRAQDVQGGAAAAPCGALLTVRREFAAGSFTPFFSDSYAKSHRGDLFGEFHKLLLESAFRLTYSLVRPGKSEKSSDKEQSSKGCPGADLKLEGWQEVLCSYINNPHTTFVRKYSRRLLLHLCGSKSIYYTVRDGWQLNREVKKLYKLVQKSGGFQSVIPYERSVKLLKCLTLIGEVASARPRNWQRYCSRHPEVLSFLLNASFCFVEELVVQTLKLLALVFYCGKDLSTSKKETIDATKKPEAKKEKEEDKGYLDMEQAVDQLVGEDEKNLKNFLDAFLLEWNATSVRSEAKAVLSGAWHHGGHAFKVLLLTLLLERVPVLPSYGQNVQEFNELLSWLLKKGTQELAANNQETVLIQGCLTGNIIKKVFETLRLQNELLANHPNSRIYSTLASLVEFDGFYLESEPCLACNSPEVPYARMKLDNIKAETKFTDNRILVKCIGSHTIQSVTMNVHEPRRSKSIRVLNLYYNNRVVADLSELKNNSSLWKRAKSCQLNFGQTELKVEFPIPITACNFMIELDCFYENLQAASLESLQCPRCSRLVTDKHGICGNCHENAYQCRQCRNINYENLDSFLCNECGYSKYGRFEFNFMAKPSYVFDRMENDEDMKKGLAAIEAESDNAHKKYQQLLGYKKPLLKLVSSIGENELDSQQKDSVQQMIVPLAGSASFKINRKIAILGVLYGEKCKTTFDSVSKSVQTLQGLRRVLMSYLERKKSPGLPTNTVMAHRHPNHCFGCANTFVGHCLEWLQILSKVQYCRQQLVGAGILAELFENNIHQGPKSARIQARNVLCAFTEGDTGAVVELNNLIKQKVIYCLEHHRSMDVAACVRDELQLLSETCALSDEFWEARLRVVFQLLFRSIEIAPRHPVIAEYIILPCLRIISQACTPPKSDTQNGDRVEVRSEEAPKPLIQDSAAVVTPAKTPEKDADTGSKNQDLLLVNYAEWRNGATYLDFVRRQYTVAQTARPVQKLRKDSRRTDSVALKYILRWKRRACKHGLTDELKSFEDSTWVRELVLSACSQPIRQEMCSLIEVLCSQSIVRKSKFLDLLMTLLPSSRTAGESAAEYFELLFKMIEPEEARLYLTVRGFLRTACGLITEEVTRVEAQERSFHTDISQGYILNKLIELLNKFLQVPNIRTRFMKEGLLSQVLEALLVIRGLVVQKTKLISDCGRLLKELLDNLLQESYENKRHFIRACVSGLQIHHQNRNRRLLFVLEQLCNIICPTKPEPVYMMVLNKAHTQEEFIRGSMTKNPYSSLEVGPLMRDVKNKICQQLELLGLLEDDYGMELLVAGNIISLDLTVVLVYEQVWRKAHSQSANLTSASLLVSPGISVSRECPPMTVTYRLQGLDGEATEPMIKELDDDREETQDPEVEFAITGVMNECGGLAVLLKIVQQFTDEELKSNPEQIALVLKLLMFCCKIRKNREALLQLGALDVLLETARRAFSSESVQALLLIVEYLVSEANENDIGLVEDGLSSSSARGEQAAKGVLMFLERLSSTASTKQSKQHRNSDTVARILPYLTFGEQAAMEVLVDHFKPYLDEWHSYDELQKQFAENSKDTVVSQKAAQHQLALDNFVKMTESIKLNVFGERLKDLIVEKQIVNVATKYLKKVFPISEGKDYKASPEWNQGLELASVPIVLSMLRGLSRGHLMTQQCLDTEGILPLLHALEGVSGDNEVGARAENLLDTLSDKEPCGEGFLAEKIMSLRETTRDEMKRRALQRREELLQGLGMRRELRSDGGERIIISQPSIEGLEDIEEEEAGLACMVCREGYKLRPTDMLGTYSYSKRVNIGPTGTMQGRAEWAYTTVSYFNIIHFQCHLEAKRADASLKNPKKEWDGAALRNSETLCNNLFPLRGPAVPLAQYIRCVDTFWDGLNGLGRADGSRLRLLTYDIVLMLGRFATGASFSTDCKGGGKESNSRFLPFMFQMARHLMDQQGLSQRRSQAKVLQTYLAPDAESPATARVSSTPQRSEDSVQYMMLQSVLLQSYDEWQQHRKAFLRRGAAHAYMLHKQGRAMLPTTSDVKRPTPETTSGTTGLSSEQLFNILKPMLVYIGIIDQIQRYLKCGSGTKSSRPAASTTAGAASSEETAAAAAASPGFGGAEPWEMTMKEKLRDISSMLSFSKQLLEWLDEMQSSEDLQEAVDVMGALSDVLCSGVSSCDRYFLDAIGLPST